MTDADPGRDALALGDAKVGATTLHLTLGIGSGLFHAKGDPEDVFYTVSDRGPNLDRDDAARLLGVPAGDVGRDPEADKLFPVPDYAPSIFKISLGADGTFRVLNRIAITDSQGRPISGLPNPLTQATTETAHGSDGKPLAADPNGLDTEGIVRLADGSFWLADEYAPSLVHVAADGPIIKRLVPVGLEADLAGATYEIRGALPAILAKRHINRGFEGVALSPDERYLYALMQSPLANPDEGTFIRAKVSRILKIDLAAGKTIGTFLYQLDGYDSFANDRAAVRQSEVRLSDVVAIGPDRLIVLERISKTAKLYAVELACGSNIHGSRWDDANTQPTVEQLTPAGLVEHGLVPVAKTLWLDSKDWPALPKRLEGIAVSGPGTLVFVNDNDFGIDGAATSFLRLKLTLPGV